MQQDHTTLPAVRAITIHPGNVCPVWRGTQPESREGCSQMDALNGHSLWRADTARKELPEERRRDFIADTPSTRQVHRVEGGR